MGLRSGGYLRDFPSLFLDECTTGGGGEREGPSTYLLRNGPEESSKGKTL